MRQTKFALEQSYIKELNDFYTAAWLVPTVSHGTGTREACVAALK